MAFTLFSTFVQSLRRPLLTGLREFHALPKTTNVVDPALTASPWSLSLVRTNVRNRFPKPREVKRLKVHGWWTRLQTTNGKKILMRRILKGRHFLAHGW